MFKQIGLIVGSWTHKKIVDPLLQILRRGTEPKQLAFSGALGVALGLFPICGVAVFLCGLAIAVLGSLCHAPTVLLANFVVTPIELCLVIPFLRLGEYVSGGPHFALTSDALKKVLTGNASWEVLLSIYHASICLYFQVKPLHRNRVSAVLCWGLPEIASLFPRSSGKLLGWFVAVPFILAGVYILFLPLFTILVRKFSSLPPSKISSIPSSPKRAVPPSPKKAVQPLTEVSVKVRDV